MVEGRITDLAVGSITRMDFIGVCGFCDVNTEKEAMVVKSSRSYWLF